MPISKPESVMSHFGQDESLPAQGAAESAPENAFTSEGGHVAGTREADSALPANATESDDERLMAYWDISFADGQYVFAAFRYDRLADAVAYAQLERTRFAA